MVLANDGNCFKCGKPGHWIQHCPLNEVADDWNAHLARLDEIKRRFLDFEITVIEKTQLILSENKLWKDKGKVKAK